MTLGRGLAAIGALVAVLVVASPSVAGGATRLEQAREESGVEDAPRTRHDLPAGVLRLSRSELLAASFDELEISVTLDRDVADGALELTLPSRWIGRSGVSDLRYARVPAAGRGSGSSARAVRDGRVVRFSFHDAQAGEAASFTVTDAGLPAGRYDLPYRWSATAGASSRGTAQVVFFAPVREEAENEGEVDWRVLLRDVNATNDVSEESETFISVVPGNTSRLLVGANGGGGYNAWITNTGSAPFTKAPVSATIDAPGEIGPETADLCCDPMSAADAAGNIWYGGLADRISAASPSRIVVARSAPGTTSFVNTVGLPQRTNAGVQDKPMMTIDNSPTSPAFGRLYVVWDEPGAGVDIVMSQCDTRPGGVSNPANCDNADNWSTPIPVTPFEGSYIYADVATAPDGKVYVVWWDYSATNAIRGDVCAPASQNCASAAGWGTPQTIATLDATGGPLTFACPIVAQPGGRASTSPQVDVDRSGGPNNGRVYVTWSDLRTGSGTTRCGEDPSTEEGLPPASTHLTWDSFVASAAGGLPGGASRSPDVATRLLTDGEAGGQSNSDEWFAWLSVDQTNGLAWADFYSTRDDPTRRTTQFYARAVAPTPEGHALGPLRRTSSAASDYSGRPCCTFGNDYGDYTGIDATGGRAFPVWSDRRSGLDGEAFVDSVQSAAVVGVTRTIDDSAAAGGDGDGVLERGESLRVDQVLRNVGPVAAMAVSAVVSGPAGSGVTPGAGAAYPDIAVGGTAGSASPLTARMATDAPCGAPVPLSVFVTVAGESAVVPLPAIPTACPPPSPPPPPPAVVVPPPPVPLPPPPPALDTTISFALTARSPQRPPTSLRGIVVTLSCPREDCRVTLRGRVTIPAARAGAPARRVNLASRTLQVRQGRRRTYTLRFSPTLRAQVNRALRDARTRNRVRLLVTATARDAAANASRKTKTISIRR